VRRKPHVVHNHSTDTKAAKDYFTEHLSRSDYYLRDAQETVGQWHGRGAELLGLSGQVDKDSYFRLCENLDPKTGEQLTPRTKAERRVLYDFTFDAPKSATLAYELGGDERILDAFRASVKETMGEMEDAMRVRVRVSGSREDRASCNMVWGEFIHRTTRPVDGIPDPQLHCHAGAFNASFDPVEERWKAGEFGNLVRDKGYYQAAFHSRFAGKMVALGYGIERDGNSFRLSPSELMNTPRPVATTHITSTCKSLIGKRGLSLSSRITLAILLTTFCPLPPARKWCACH
jgi:conjugative relaxase-like TrwC/TraI family protein